ncbi:MAG TPA: hypothetical protein DHV48_05280 [Prolixibacteraceae bacterium]|nr:hypothetical protein [Prolixibacteraceae bacterium]
MKKFASILFFVKTLIFKTTIIFALMVGLVGLSGCGKDKEVLAPSVTLTVSSSLVKYGESVTITWSSTNSNYCMLNGERVACSGSMLRVMLEPTTFTITAYGDTQTSTDKKNVEVEIPMKITFGKVANITMPKFGEAIRYGDKAKISWDLEGSIKTAKLKNEKGLDINISAGSGIYETDGLLENTSYTIEATDNKGVTTTQTITIPVSDWTTSPFGLLTHNPVWKLVKKEALTDDLKFDYDFIVQSEEFHIFPDNTYKYYYKGEYVGNGNWFLKENETIFLKNQINDTIIILKKDSFVFVIPSINIETGKPTYFKDYYTH